MSDINVLQNWNGKTVLYWDFQPSLAVAKYFKLYYSLRKNGPYTFVKNVANGIAYSHRYVLAEMLRTDPTVDIPVDANYYVKYTKVTGPSGAPVESSINAAEPKIIYQDGMILSSGTNYQDIDYQDAGAADIDFTTTDRFDSTLKSVLITRSTTNAITYTITLKGDGQEFILDSQTGFTGKILLLDFNQELYDTSNRDVRVVTTGISGGTLKVLIGRKRVTLVAAAS